jgi:hypothetical protein
MIHIRLLFKPKISLRTNFNNCKKSQRIACSTTTLELQHTLLSAKKYSMKRVDDSAARKNDDQKSPQEHKKTSAV